MENPERRLLNRRTFIAASGALCVPAALSAQALPFDLKGRFIQSGYAIGHAKPDVALSVDGLARGRTSVDGWFYVGLDRDAPKTCVISAGSESYTLSVAPTQYNIQRVNGLPQQTVTPTDPAIVERTKREGVLKQAAFKSRIDADYFKDGFIWPLKDFRVSGRFGNQRVLNGEPKSPHYGFDMAAPEGTPIRAPQAGLIVLAEPDMFFEGGLIFIDHGQGLISMYLHMSRLDVKAGDIVAQGQTLGAVGAKGRATGPHLCWRLKWSGRNMDPSVMVV